jgi:hypothetical protein
MSSSHIKESVESVIDDYTNHLTRPETLGAPVTAIIEDELRCWVEASDGTPIVTDVLTGIGGFAD